MSHIPQSGDATTSPTGDMDVSAWDAHLRWETTASPERDAASPEGDLLASSNFGICDTTHSLDLKTVDKVVYRRENSSVQANVSHYELAKSGPSFDV